MSLATLFIIAVFWNYSEGKDLNWDLLNYHLYAPELMVNGRWRQDYFAASIQSYLNPIGYLPFYAMVKASWPDWLIAGLLTCLHFLNIVFIWKIALLVIKTPDTRLLFLAGGLALATPLFLMELGTSFNDIIASGFILASVLTLLRTALTRSKLIAIWMSGAGALAGGAIGIKLTNGLYAGPLCLMGVYLLTQNSHLTLKDKIIGMAALCGAMIMAFGSLHGYWSWKLWTEFQNPFFPFFNGIFKSADYLPVNIRDARFLSSGVAGALLLPFEMARSEAWIYAELVAPDIRPAAFFAILISSSGIAIWRFAKADDACVRRTSPSTQRLIAVILFAVASFIIWAVVSRIGRYAMPILLLIAPVSVALTSKYLKSRYALTLVWLLLCIQGYVNHINLDRWEGVKWTGQWFDFELPPVIKDHPVSLVTIDSQPLGAVATFLHPKTAISNISGQYVQPSGYEIAQRLEKLLEDQTRPIYLLRAIALESPRKSIGVRAIETDLGALNDVLLPYKLGIENGVKCQVGQLIADPVPSQFGEATAKVRGMDLYFCKLSRTNNKIAYDAAEKTRKFDGFFELYEAACGESFSPANEKTVLANGQRTRTYFNTGTKLFIEYGGLYSSAFRVMGATRLMDVLPGSVLPSGGVQCPKKTGRRYIE